MEKLSKRKCVSEVWGRYSDRWSNAAALQSLSKILTVIKWCCSRTIYSAGVNAVSFQTSGVLADDKTPGPKTSSHFFSRLPVEKVPPVLLVTLVSSRSQDVFPGW